MYLSKVVYPPPTQIYCKLNDFKRSGIAPWMRQKLVVQLWLAGSASRSDLAA